MNNHHGGHSCPTWSVVNRIHPGQSHATTEIASVVKEIDGSSLLESLAINHFRIRQYVRNIKEEVSKYTSVTFSWTRSHTTSNSFIALGNKEADKLAKQGLAAALAND